jgi:SAM-dependent methyltransferase
MEEIVTRENFKEDLYLAWNPDVAASVSAGHFLSGREHFLKHGIYENRKIRFDTSILNEARKAKLEKIRPFLRQDMKAQHRGAKLDYISDELRKATRIVSTSNVSSNGYDGETSELIRKHDLVLDCGSGRRQEYFDNVINYEIVDYDTTDIIGVGERLPFKDNTFDAVISIAVLEHVRDPFICAKEISRVLKPGGELFCSVPFLQPYHGYPHHYFNATHQGIRRLFEDELTINKVYIPEVGHPAYTLHWILRSWVNGLPEEARDEFRGMSVGELLSKDPSALPGSRVGKLNPDASNELACSFVLKAKKRRWTNRISGLFKK